MLYNAFLTWKNASHARKTLVNKAFNFSLTELERLYFPYVSLLKMKTLFLGRKRHFVPLMQYLYLVLFCMFKKIIRAPSGKSRLCFHPRPLQ